ncbi:MAG TPA: hypothetical protein DHM42_04495 [Clostridiales bacterium]|jgi:hypothetical protein|nr:hypothetical protein [Clostridiales bacterium]
MRYIKNKKGSSSILVVVTFTMLVIFSLLVMISSYSDYKLAQKNSENTEAYYKLSGQANEFWYDIESIISNNSSKNPEEIIKELYKYDSSVFVEINDNSLVISRTFFNNKNKELYIELLYNKNNKEIQLLALKEIPKEFEYEDIDFEDVEVINQ